MVLIYRCGKPKQDGSVRQIWKGELSKIYYTVIIQYSLNVYIRMKMFDPKHGTIAC